MEQSRLRLEHYNLQRVSLQPVDDVEPTPLGAYANFAHAKLGSKVVTGSPSRLMVIMSSLDEPATISPSIDTVKPAT